MKYKIGDKVKIKDSIFYCDQARRDLLNLTNNGIATIKKIDVNDKNEVIYRMKEIDWQWKEEYFEKDFIQEEISNPIYNRFEIMDL